MTDKAWCDRVLYSMIAFVWGAIAFVVWWAIVVDT